MWFIRVNCVIQFEEFHLWDSIFRISTRWRQVPSSSLITDSFIHSFIHSSVTTEVISSIVISVVLHCVWSRALPHSNDSFLSQCTVMQEAGIYNCVTNANRLWCLSVRYNRYQQTCAAAETRSLGHGLVSLCLHNNNNNNNKVFVRSFVCDQPPSSPVCNPPCHIGTSESLLVARQAPTQLPRECLHAEAAACRDWAVRWGLVVPAQIWWGEEVDKFKAAVSPNMV